ncbi:MAG: hypothetical protein IJH92_07995 [Mogibacterium sp.]|nr:hypothetical protein [Mogibacterium sp.]
MSKLLSERNNSHSMSNATARQTAGSILDHRWLRAPGLAAVVLAAALIAAVFASAMAVPSYAASKPKLNKANVMLEAGAKISLKVSNAGRKVKWSTSDRSVARIVKKSGKYNNKAVIKAGSKTGKCTIKAKVGKKTLKCTVKVSASGRKDPDDRDIEIRPLSDDLYEISGGYSYAPNSNGIVSEEFAGQMANFSVELLRETIKADESGDSQGAGSGQGAYGASNVLISPDSVLTALVMTENGAHGTTLREMERVLSGDKGALGYVGTLGDTEAPGGNDASDGERILTGNEAPGLDRDAYNKYLSILHTRLEKPVKPIYTCANSIWVKRGLMVPKESFVETNKTLHNAVVYEAAFDPQTVTDMNNWVFNNTRNMIDGIIDRLDPDDRIVLVNAIAFEGKWQEQFADESVDTNGTFTKADGSKVKANMIRGFLGKDKAAYMEINGAKAFSKLYEYSEESTGSSAGVDASEDTAGGSNVEPKKGLAFVGILPPEGVNAEEWLGTIKGSDIISAWKNPQERAVNLQMPEFKYDYDVKMKKLLMSMGMEEAFTNNADFSEMTEGGGVHIDEVIHKTHIELDRNGTKAAAVAAVIGKANSAYDPNPPVSIILDRPFVYAIVDCETGIPLFIGVVNDPSK